MTALVDIEGIGETYAAKAQEVNTTKKVVRSPPVLSQVTDWVEQAKKLPRIINY